jgi:prenyl protein peptidase
MLVTLLHALACGAQFVGLLYCVPARVRAQARDATEHVIWRLALVLPSSLIAPALALFWLSSPPAAAALVRAGLSASDALGVSARCLWGGGLAAAAAAPLATAALLLGPALQAALHGECSLRSARGAARRACGGGGACARTARTLVVAPAAEEWVFRACVLPVAAARGVPASGALAAAAVAFGAAHLHHASELRRAGASAGAAAAAVAGQAAYTSAFGAVAAFALLRTGSVPGVVAMHALCNWWGLPDVPDALAAHGAGHPLHAWRWPLAAAYAAGIALSVAAFARMGAAGGAADADAYPCALAPMFS